MKKTTNYKQNRNFGVHMNNLLSNYGRVQISDFLQDKELKKKGGQWETYYNKCIIW